MPGAAPAFFRQTLSVLGPGQDARGQVYILGNRIGRPFGTGGAMLRLLTPER